MKDEKKKLELHNPTVYQTNENCQVFNGPISGCVFAMPGANVSLSANQVAQDATAYPIDKSELETPAMQRETKRETSQDDDVVKTFVEWVKQIMMKAQELYGKRIVYLNNRHVECSYMFNFDTQHFCEVMDKVKELHPNLIVDYLEGRTGSDACGVTMVCPFIGCVLGLHLFNNKDVRNVDFESVFVQVYGSKNEKGKKPSYIQKMSATSEIREKKIFNTIKKIALELKKE